MLRRIRLYVLIGVKLLLLSSEAGHISSSYSTYSVEVISWVGVSGCTVLGSAGGVTSSGGGGGVYTTWESTPLLVLWLSFTSVCGCSGSGANTSGGSGVG